MEFWNTFLGVALGVPAGLFINWITFVYIQSRWEKSKVQQRRQHLLHSAKTSLKFLLAEVEEIIKDIVSHVGQATVRRVNAEELRFISQQPELTDDIELRSTIGEVVARSANLQEFLDQVASLCAQRILIGEQQRSWNWQRLVEDILNISHHLHEIKDESPYSAFDIKLLHVKSQALNFIEGDGENEGLKHTLQRVDLMIDCRIE